MRERRIVHPAIHRIVKFFPNIPLERGDTVLVDGERCRVCKAKIRWEGCIFYTGRVVVEPAPLSSDPKESE